MAKWYTRWITNPIPIGCAGSSPVVDDQKIYKPFLFFRRTNLCTYMYLINCRHFPLGILNKGFKFASTNQLNLQLFLHLLFLHDDTQISGEYHNYY